MTKEEFLTKLTYWFDRLRCGDCLNCKYYFYSCGHNLIKYILENKFKAKLIKKEEAPLEYKFADYLEYEIDNLIISLAPQGFEIREEK
jgi:hypothetical protein